MLLLRFVVVRVGGGVLSYCCGWCVVCYVVRCFERLSLRFAVLCCLSLLSCLGLALCCWCCVWFVLVCVVRCVSFVVVCVVCLCRLGGGLGLVLVW